MVRSRRIAEYCIVKRHAAMKGHKGTGKSIIATDRQLGKINWYMLKNDIPGDTFRMIDSNIVQTEREMLASVDDSAQTLT